MSSGTLVTGFFAALRMTSCGILVLLGLLSIARAAEAEWRLSPRKIRDEVHAVVEAQLAALRAGDFPAAYAFAAEGIKRQFDERLFAAMIKRGYPPLLRQDKTDLGVVRDDGGDLAEILVTVTDRQNQGTVYRYILSKERAGWRISGVVLAQRPLRGDT